MFVCNFKVNKNFWYKFFVFIIFVIAIIILGFTIYRLCNFTGSDTINDNFNNQNVQIITATNYTNVLKTVHENINDYIGQRICFTGYVYRVYDLKQNEFVLARNMVISSDFQTLVVGFLCSCDNALNYSDGTWVSITR